MKILIWVGCLFVGALISTLTSMNGGGALFAFLFQGGSILLAIYLSKQYDRREALKQSSGSNESSSSECVEDNEKHDLRVNNSLTGDGDVVSERGQIRNRDDLSAALEKLYLSVDSYHPATKEGSGHFQYDFGNHHYPIVCDFCSKPAEIDYSFEDSPPHLEYRKVAKEMCDMGYVASVRCICNDCADKIYPSENRFYHNNILFSFSFGDGDLPKIKICRSKGLFDPAFSIAAAFLRGNTTVKELAKATNTNYHAQTYIRAVKDVIGEGTVHIPCIEDIVRDRYNNMKALLQESSIPNNEASTELLTAIYIVCDFAAASSNKDRAAIAKAVEYELYQINPTYAMVTSIEKKNSKRSLYGEIIRGKEPRGDWFLGNKSGFIDIPIGRIALLLGDLIYNPKCADNYDNAPVVLHGAHEAVRFTANVMMPIFQELMGLFDDVYDL